MMPVSPPIAGSDMKLDVPCYQLPAPGGNDSILKVRAAICILSPRVYHTDLPPVTGEKPLPGQTFPDLSEQLFRNLPVIFHLMFTRLRVKGAKKTIRRQLAALVPSFASRR